MIVTYAEKCHMQEIDFFNVLFVLISLLIMLIVGVYKLSYNHYKITFRLLYFLIVPILSVRNEDIESDTSLYIYQYFYLFSNSLLYFQSFSFLLVCENIFSFQIMPYYTYIRLLLFIFLYYFHGYEWFQRLIFDPVCGFAESMISKATKND